MSPALFFATMAAGFAYVISPGPAFLAVFGLAAARGRPAAARFVVGHLAGDLTWGALALAAIIGVSTLGPLLFDLLGLACGTYLVFLGLRALFAPRGAGAQPVGARRPLVTGLLFGLTNPKAYPVATAMFTAIAMPYAGSLQWRDAPAMLATALIGFLLADVVIVAAAGLPGVRRFFGTHMGAVSRMTGLLFVGFGVRSLAEAGRSLAGRT